MPTIDLSKIDVGGPCKISDNGTILYFETGVTIEPKPVWRGIPSSVGGEHDDVLKDLVWTVRGTPKAVWSTRTALIPTAYTNWSTAGARLIGAANRAVSIIGSDAHGFDFTRMCVTKPPEVFFGLGESLFGEVEYTGFIGNGKALSDADAFYTENTTAWSQSDYPTAHQEAMCQAAWGSVTGWDVVFAEKGFKLTHEFKTNPVYQGSITVDQRIESYRAMVAFDPEQPTTTQLLSALAMSAIGSRRSASANTFTITGSGISCAMAGAALRKGTFLFDNKTNRHGEFAMITSLTAPGTRLTLS